MLLLASATAWAWHWSLGTFATTAGFIVAAWFLFALVYCVRIDEDGISGPSRWFLIRKTIPLDQVDIERSRRRSFVDRATGFWTIWSGNGARIAIATRILGDAATREILHHARVLPSGPVTSTVRENTEGLKNGSPRGNA